jgi:hypothetical protein
MPKPLICVYCREPIALRRDNYLLRPPEHTAGGDYWPAHLACAEAHRQDAEAHPPTEDRGPIRDRCEILYVTRRAGSRFARVIPRVVPSAVRRGLAWFRWWRTGQAPQDGVVLTLCCVTGQKSGALPIPATHVLDTTLNIDFCTVYIPCSSGVGHRCIAVTSSTSSWLMTRRRAST